VQAVVLQQHLDGLAGVALVADELLGVLQAGVLPPLSVTTSLPPTTA
jgi:hypothetical protein